MARTTSLVCDVCGENTNRLVGKMYFSPIVPGAARLNLSNYTHWADVGECCQAQLLERFNFQPRVTASEYNERRKSGVR